MQVVEVESESAATIIGFTQAHCIYRHAWSDELIVAPWREVALCNILPAAPLLPDDVTQIDRANAGAAALRELLALKPFGLTDAQSAALEELITELCGSRRTT